MIFEVLIPFDYSPAINKLNQVGGGLGDRFIEFYKSNYRFHRDFERGNISENEFEHFKRLENQVAIQFNENGTVDNSFNLERVNGNSLHTFTGALQNDGKLICLAVNTNANNINFYNQILKKKKRQYKI